MNRKELKNKIECVEENLLKLKEELENIEDTNFEYDTNNNGWYIDEFGSTLSNEYFSDDITKNYNYFANEEYAAKVAYKQWFERKLLAYKDEHDDKCDWHDDDYKYYAYLDLGEDEVGTNVCRSVKCSDICFHSENLLLKHIEDNKEEWIKYFNICKELD